MIPIVDGDELIHEIKTSTWRSTDQGGTVWLRQSEVLEKIEKHTIGFLTRKSIEFLSKKDKPLKISRDSAKPNRKRLQGSVKSL